VDEAFSPLHAIVRGMVPGDVSIRDDEMGTHMYLRRIAIEAPVELDVTRDGDGVAIGSTPPLYYVETSLRPSYHQIRFTAELDEETDG
jgi:hypothetical protein